MHNYDVAVCKSVYSKKQVWGANCGIFWVRWLRKTARWPTSLTI